MKILTVLIEDLLSWGFPLILGEDLDDDHVPVD
jgi:hypothetical protein